MPASKMIQAEVRVGMSVSDYLKQAIRDGVKVQDMADALGVSRATAWLWLRIHGYRSGYRRARVA